MRTLTPAPPAVATPCVTPPPPPWTPPSPSSWSPVWAQFTLRLPKLINKVLFYNPKEDQDLSLILTLLRGKDLFRLDTPTWECINGIFVAVFLAETFNFSLVSSLLTILLSLSDFANILPTRGFFVSFQRQKFPLYKIFFSPNSSRFLEQTPKFQLKQIFFLPLKLC